MSKLQIKPITSEEFGRFLVERGVSSQCKECNFHKTTIQTNDKGIVLHTDTSLEERSGFMIDRNHFPTYAVVCYNCGHTRQFSAVIVQEQIQKTQRGDS